MIEKRGGQSAAFAGILPKREIALSKYRSQKRTAALW